MRDLARMDLDAQDWPTSTAAASPPPPPMPEAWTEAHLDIRVDTPRGQRRPIVTARPASPWDRCPHCRGLGSTSYTDEATGYTYARACRCARLARMADALTAARLPAAFAKATLAGLWPAALYGDPMTLRPGGGATRRWVDQWTLRARGRVLYGPPGTGKSWLVAATLRALALRGVSVRWVGWAELLDDMRDAYARRDTEAALVGPLHTCGVLAVDELGQGQRTEWADLALERIVGRRLEDGGTVLATSNAASPAALRALLGDRVYSRLAGACELREVAGEDLRRAT